MIVCIRVEGREVSLIVGEGEICLVSRIRVSAGCLGIVICAAGSLDHEV